MVDDQEIRLAVVEYLTDIAEPEITEMGIHCIQHGDLFIHDDVGVVRNAMGNGVQPLKKVDRVIVHAHIADIIGDVHRYSSLN